MNLYIYILIISILAKSISMLLGKYIINEKSKERFLATEIIKLKEKCTSEASLNQELEKLYKDHNYLFFTKYVLIVLNSIISLSIFYLVIDLTNILSYLNISFTNSFLIFNDITTNTFYTGLFVIYIFTSMFETFIVSTKNTKWFLYSIPILTSSLIFFVLKFKIYVILYFITRAILGIIIHLYKKTKYNKKESSSGN